MKKFVIFLLLISVIGLGCFALAACDDKNSSNCNCPYCTQPDSTPNDSIGDNNSIDDFEINLVNERYYYDNSNSRRIVLFSFLYPQEWFNNGIHKIPKIYCHIRVEGVKYQSDKPLITSSSLDIFAESYLAYTSEEVYTYSIVPNTYVYFTIALNNSIWEESSYIDFTLCSTKEYEDSFKKYSLKYK